MTERIYMVEQIEVMRARILSCWATYDLAKIEVEKILDTMPKGAGGSHGKWMTTRTRKRASPNHGKTEMLWHCNQVGPSTRQVSALTIISFEVQGSAVDRLGALAGG